jgi:hypothetical protein
VVQTRSRTPIVVGLIATFAPLGLLLSNTDWFLTREGYLDPWNYVGLFQQYLDPDYLPEDYKLARLPWILAGALAAQVGTSVTAAYVLHGAFLSATSCALFVGLFALLQRPALAGVVSLSLGFYTHAHGSGGWDYHNTGAGAFFLATFALLTLPAAIDGLRVVLVAAGAMAALAVHTNVTLVNFLPALIFVHIQVVKLRTAGRSSPGLVERLGWGLLGGLLVTSVLGLVNWWVGRDFLFYGRLLSVVLRFVSDTSNVEVFHQPWSSGWLFTARYLALPGAVFLAGIIFMVANGARGTSSGRIAGALVAQHVVMVLVWLAWQTAGQLALNWDYFAYVLIPGCFIAIGGLLSRGWPDWYERHWLISVVGSIVLIGGFLVVESIPAVRLIAAAMASNIFIWGSLVLLVPFLAYRWRPSLISAALVVVTFAVGNRLVAPGYPDYFATDPCKVQPTVYGAIADAASWLMTDVDPLYTRARIWFDENEIVQPVENCPVRLGHMANSIATMASMRYVAQAFPLPGIDAVPDGAVAALTADGILVIISNSPAHLDAWGRRIAAMGLTHAEIQSHRIPMLASGFTIHAWSIHSAAQ